MTHLTVAVRVRPLSDREITTKSVSIVSVENGKTISVTNVKVPEQNAGDSRERIRRFTFDYCFNTDSSQEDVFQNIGKEIAKAIRKRFHACVLAYGQSSTGKTHTMIGQENNPGLVPKLCENIFDYLAETAVGSEKDGLNATVSYLEIYNEKVRDLLDTTVISSGNTVSLKVREHPKRGPYVQDLIEKTVTDAAGLLNCLETGNLNRRTAATNANPRSSRSHCVFTVTCSGGVKLKLVDLAGSERAGSRCHTTPRFREGANINRSLVALRNVISALADQSRPSKTFRKRFIPYRDSTLTWLLKDTLGGNSKTTMISTISPSSTCYNETVNTLRFGQRAKQIVVQPIVNEDPKERTIRELRAEIAKLKDLLASQVINSVDANEHIAIVNKYYKSPWDSGHKNVASELIGYTNWADLTDNGLTSSPYSYDKQDYTSEVIILNQCLNCPKNFQTYVYPTTIIDEPHRFFTKISAEFASLKQYLHKSTDKPPTCTCSRTSSTTTLESNSELLNFLRDHSSCCNKSILKCSKTKLDYDCPKSVTFSSSYIKTYISNEELGNSCVITEVLPIDDDELESQVDLDEIVVNEDILNDEFVTKNSNEFGVYDVEPQEICLNRKSCLDIYLQKEPKDSYKNQINVPAGTSLIPECNNLSFHDLDIELSARPSPIEKRTFVDLKQLQKRPNAFITTSKEAEELLNKLLEERKRIDLVAQEDIASGKNISRKNADLLFDKLIEDRFGGVTNVASFTKTHDEFISSRDFVDQLLEERKNLEVVAQTTNISRLEIELDDFPKRIDTDFCMKVEQLIPVMEVTQVNKKAKSPLRRTFSVDQKVETQTVNMFGSHEVLPSSSKVLGIKKAVATLRKRSMDTSTTSLRSEKSTSSNKSTATRRVDTSLVMKSEKGVVTEVKGSPKIPIKSKVDSHRRLIPKPRSQIVAAVTQRLYNKVKKKDSSTDTAEDINTTTVGVVPKELSICSNARLRLQELTQKALKANRRRNEETQTEIISVLRVKEISTDVDDLKQELGEVKDSETSTIGLETCNVATNTQLDFFAGNDEETLTRAFVFTRTCGTQSDDISITVQTMTDLYKLMQPIEDKPLPISFTKYLQEPKFELVKPCSMVHPIYTSSVNINVNHNYTHTNDSVSDDSLEETPTSNVCLPTPDLISNHNSLEQHASTESRKELRFATNDLIEEEVEEEIINEFGATQNPICAAICSLVQPHSEYVEDINVEETYAPQTCWVDDEDDDYNVFKTKAPQTHKAYLIAEPLLNNAVKIEAPAVLKRSETIDQDSERFSDAKNSLDYYSQKKKVSFTNNDTNSRVMDAMTNFLQEVVTTMSTLTNVASRLDSVTPSSTLVDASQLVEATLEATENYHKKSSCEEKLTSCIKNMNTEQCYDVQLIVNDVQGLPKMRSKPKRRVKRVRSCTHAMTPSCSEHTQTSPIRENASTIMEEDYKIINKYDDVVIDSCDRLEKLISKFIGQSGEESGENRNRTQLAFDNLHRFPQPFSVNADWHTHSNHSMQSNASYSKSNKSRDASSSYLPNTSYNSNYQEDSSLESNPTFSDYGSLPRRKYHTRVREPTCSPSGYLRQLTTMRKQIVESSREEMMNDTQLDM